MTVSRLHGARSILLLASVLMAGCASTAVDVSSWNPASANIVGLRRIAVVQFEGPEELTREIQHRISDALNVSGAYQLCDPSRIEMAMQSRKGRPPDDVHAALDAARHQGIDAILIGKVRRKSDYGLDLGSIYVRVGDPELLVSVSYELIDVRTGDIRARNTSEQRFNDEVSGSSSASNSEEKVLARLTNKCLQELITEVAPHQQKSQVKLAGGTLGIASGNLRKGNAAAANGDWATARQEWQTVLHANPDSHAAQYNLGVADEVEGDFAAAAAAYREAQRRVQKDLYRTALARVERAAEGQRLVFAQRSSGQQMAARPARPMGPPSGVWNQPTTSAAPAFNQPPPANPLSFPPRR